MKYLYGVCIAYLVVLQVDGEGTIDVYNAVNHLVHYFSYREATTIDASATISGYIENANPLDACTPIALPTYKRNGQWRNIVLINGTSECDFMTKIRFAKEVGYEAAVLFDPFPGPFNYSDMEFPFPRSEIDISVVLVSREDGTYIQNNFVYPQPSELNNVYIYISSYTWGTVVFYFFVGAGSILLTCALLISLIAVFDFIRDKWGNRSGSRNQMESIVDGSGRQHVVEGNVWSTHRTRSGSQHVVEANVERTHRTRSGSLNDVETHAARICQNKLYKLRCALSNLRKRYPSQVFSIGDPFENCTICLSNYKPDEMLRVLGCSHAYHADCIDEWLLRQTNSDDQTPTCPLCVDNINLENSCEQPHCSASETTPLLTSMGNPYSSIGARGSVNSEYQNQSV